MSVRKDVVRPWRDGLEADGNLHWYAGCPRRVLVKGGDPVSSSCYQDFEGRLI